MRLFYDVTGEGTAVMLLHGGGGGQTRHSWHQAGYVERLQGDFKVITMDIRGHGESDKPTDPAAYSIDIMCQDILAVADACEVERFVIWGFSYGGNIARFLAAQSERVDKLVIMGIPFGLAASGDFRQFIKAFRARWTPILQAQQDGSFDMTTLTAEEQEMRRQMDIPVTLAWLTAMLDWGSVAPADLRCPTLWLTGTENEAAMASVEAYKETLKTSMVQVHVVDGLEHWQEFEEIDLVFPAMLTFTQS
jgi:pimeloyl-ACP methyl ester carboxylesterase